MYLRPRSKASSGTGMPALRAANRETIWQPVTVLSASVDSGE